MPTFPSETFDADWKAFVAKTFYNGQLVKVKRMGENKTGEYRGIIQGVYSIKPFEMYIVKWIDFPHGLPASNEWTCSVMAKGCIHAV